MYKSQVLTRMSMTLLSSKVLKKIISIHISRYIHGKRFECLNALTVIGARNRNPYIYTCMCCSIHVYGNVYANVTSATAADDGRIHGSMRRTHVLPPNNDNSPWLKWSSIIISPFKWYQKKKKKDYQNNFFFGVATTCF